MDFILGEAWRIQRVVQAVRRSLLRLWCPKQDRGLTTAEDKISETWSLPRCDKGKERSVCVVGE